MIRRGRPIWLCLHFPRLALEIFDDPAGDEAGHPLAVAEAQHIHVADDGAAAHGVEPGLALATARALCPSLRLLERRPRREGETLQQLAHWAYRFTPAVVCADANSLLLEVGSCRRLYGGLAPLLTALRDDLAQRGHIARPALAHTPKAAWLLAQMEIAAESLLAGDDLDTTALQAHLQQLPVALLPLAPKLPETLEHMGIATLGQLAALPQPALGKRFGAELIRYLQQLLGFHPDPQPPFQPAPRFERGLNFIDGIRDRQMLQFPMKRLLHSLADYLDARQLHCRALHWHLYDAHRVQAQLTVELSRARQPWKTLLELSRIRLEQLPLEGAVFGLALSSDRFLAARPGATDLFAADDDEPAAALLDRLKARLGGDALQQLDALPSRWPAQAWRAVDAGTATAAEPPPEGGPRPLWLLPRPQPLREPPQLLRGPERIDSHWWQQAATARDYYIARDNRQRLCWVFRDAGGGPWFLHGLFG